MDPSEEIPGVPIYGNPCSRGAFHTGKPFRRSTLAASAHPDGTVINWGLGADSTAYLERMLTDPAPYGIDLERTAVLYLATGREWPETLLRWISASPAIRTCGMLKAKASAVVGL